MSWRSYVAVGDSFTEGLDDRDPDTADRFRGWADLVALRLAEQVDGFTYANLAVRGRLFDNIVDEQVPPTLRMQPELVSFAAGGNDALRRGFQPERLIARFDTVMAALRGTGADVIIFRFADVTKRLPGQRMILPRVTLLNEAVGRAADKHGARLVDLWADDEFANPALWSLDRLHLNARGHSRVAAHVLRVLGVPHDPAWMQAPAYPPKLSWAAARAADARWTREHLAPWVKRRLTGRSSGDHVVAKRPTLSPLTRSVTR
ncbi:MAG TPA: SGNH/GDSL hydrolase family protein [Micromonosporaceae bacterium]|nr:SGNH/GDSL hydrolase family protein [Micromonosporaceae bacterium]